MRPKKKGSEKGKGSETGRPAEKDLRPRNTNAVKGGLNPHPIRPTPVPIPYPNSA